MQTQDDRLSLIARFIVHPYLILFLLADLILKIVEGTRIYGISSLRLLMTK